MREPAAFAVIGWRARDDRASRIRQCDAYMPQMLGLENLRRRDRASLRGRTRPSNSAFQIPEQFDQLQGGIGFARDIGIG